MVAKSIKEDRVGVEPMCHSVEMLQLDDGAFEVVARLQPDSDNGSYSPPLRSIETFQNRAEAEFRYKIILGLMEKVGEPS